MFFAEILGQMTKNGRSVGRPAFEGRDAARSAPAVAALYADDDVFIEEPALLQEPHCGLRREFIRPEFANADEIAQPLGLLRLGKLEKRIQPVNFALGGRLAIL